MKQIPGILFFVLICSGLFSQTLPEQKPNITTNGKKQGGWLIWYDGKFKRTDLEDSVKYYRKVSFKNGKPVGAVHDYYRSGQLQWEGRLSSFEPEIKEGKAIWYFRNGGKLRESDFKHDKPRADTYYYYESGKLNAIERYKNGLHHGAQITWYESGVKKVEYNYKNGEKHGISTQWYENGKVKSKINYSKGKMYGERFDYYESGSLKAKGYYFNDNS